MPTVTTDTLVHTSRDTFAVRRHGGAGPWVVCVHGFPDDATTFDGLAAGLTRAGFRVAAVNLRGYAPSTLDGPFGLLDMADDLVSVVDELSPDDPVGLVGHDYGAQIAYPAMARNADRFAASVLLSGAHPNFVQRNARRSPRQLWRSRYILFFQLGAVADRRVSHDDFAYVDRLWRRWSPGYTPDRAHIRHVKDTLAASMPAPVAMYRGSGFTIAEGAIAVPTVFITGADDGCALPLLADGQDRLFTADYRAECWPNTGHFPHLERLDRTAETVGNWFDMHLRTLRGSSTSATDQQEEPS